MASGLVYLAEVCCLTHPGTLDPLFRDFPPVTCREDTYGFETCSPPRSAGSGKL